jgi:hypothetical protein
MKKLLTSLFAVAIAVPMVAQNSWPRGENQSLLTAEVPELRLPAKVDDICFVDGKIHISSGDMLFAVGVNNGKVGFPEIDTSLTAVDSKMTYAVRHPLTKTLFYTKDDGKGRQVLYEYYEKKPGKFDTRRVKPYGFSFSLEHPVFSSDGRAMVFVSDCPIGFGGLDLWYSEWRNGEWQYPRNMGHRVNSEGDETMPALYGDFLVFASNGHPDALGGSDLYATRLVALEQTGDTVEMYPIGRCEVHSLEAPFCSKTDDFGFVYNGEGYGLWLSRDTAGVEVCHSFKGRMDCINVTGLVSDVGGALLADAKVTLTSHDNRNVSVITDSEGRYSLFVQPGEEYTLTCRADEHFVSTQSLSFERRKEDRLYGAERNNIVLDAFAIGVPYSYDDLFGSSVSCELSASGRKRLDDIARFLLENPNLKLNIASAYNLSADLPFCTLLNNSRLRSLTDYLVAKGVPLVSITTSTVKPAGAESQDEDSEMMSSTAVSSRTVYFVFVR